MSKFEVTPKNTVQNEKFIYNFKIVKVQIILVILSLIGIVKILALSIYDYAGTRYPVNLLWLVYNLYLLVMAIFFASERPRFRSDERMPIGETIIIEDNNTCHKGIAFDLSKTGVSFLLDHLVYFSQDGVYPGFPTKAVISDYKKACIT